MVRSRATMLLARFSQAAQSLAFCRSLSPCLSTFPDRLLHSSATSHQQPAPASDLIEVTVNGESVQIPKGSTVMAACSAAGIDIPR
jgi:hypothetical protein